MFFYHGFHIVSNSIYPLSAAIISLALTTSSVVLFKFGSVLPLFISLLSFLFLMFIWFKDVVAEAQSGYHNFYVMDGLKFGMALFIFSEVMFFFGFFWSFFDSSLVPNHELGMQWGPVGVSAINPFDVPLLNTAVLLSSGVTATWAHHSLLNNKDALMPMLFTIGLGGYFTFLQWFEYSVASFTVSDSVFGTTFFVATGFHGLHVLIGTVFLIVTTIRMVKYHFNFLHHVGFEMCLWYWHFVDVVWLFLYVFVYWWAF
uniref:Cytochrome c oxidase subunit 3 n=1 Tax=Plectus aquatilis TaxID=70222 RepID=A0A1U7AFS8_9BILA|nr:cytochrome c oxidase subunit III [Plectus aquatilis]